MRKTWAQKLDNGREAFVAALEKPMCGNPAGTRVLVATPRLVKAYIEQIPRGREIPVERMRADLAAQHNADASCPIATGIFLRIVAEAALEQLSAGTPPDEITPFWRVVDQNSPTAKKLAGGPEFIRKMREREGITPHLKDKRKPVAKLERYRHASVRT
jgi:hypothetical protein